MSGLLMAAAAIAAFELTSSRTGLRMWYQRYLACLTTFILYLSVTLLITIAMTAMGETPGVFPEPIGFASMLVLAALFLYDVWVSIRASGGRDG